MKRINLHIDTLVLRGFRHEDRYDLVQGIHRELRQSLAEPQATDRLLAGGDLSRISTEPVQISAEDSAPHIGSQLAAGIVRRIKS